MEVTVLLVDCSLLCVSFPYFSGKRLVVVSCCSWMTSSTALFLVLLGLSARDTLAFVQLLFTVLIFTVWAGVLSCSTYIVLLLVFLLP